MSSIFKDPGVNLTPNKLSLIDRYKKHTFRDGNLEINTLQIGKLDDIYATLNATRPKTEQVEPPQEVQSIINAFNTKKKSLDNNKGEKIEKGYHLLISGGFVRDVFLGKIPNDIDFSTDMPLEEAQALLSDLNTVTKTIITGQASKALRVYFENGEDYEISFFKKPASSDASTTLHRPGYDAQARDLTVNSLLYNPATGRVIDYVGGLDDIKNNILRFSGDASERISEDNLRMLRYVRFLFKTGFDLDDASKLAIQKNAQKLTLEKDADRIKDELNKILAITSADKMLQALDDFHLLEQVLPEVKKLQNCEQGPPYHLEGNVYKHTLMVAGNLPDSASIRLKWATILHDISKPETRQEIKADGQTKVSFLHHDKKGGDKAQEILKGLRFSNKEIAQIKWLIQNHQFLFQQVSGRILQASNKGQKAEAKARTKAKASLKKIILQKGPELVDDLVQLSLADSKGKISQEGFADTSKTNNLIKEIYQEVQKDLRKARESGINPKAISKLINGNEIMSTLGIEGGPEVGRIKKQILDKVLASEKQFDNKEDIKAYITNILTAMKESQ